MTKVNNPADVVAIVPYLLGFDPVESIVVVALEGPRQRFGPCARLDLVTDDESSADVEVLADYLLELIERHQFDPVILVVYSTRTLLSDAVMRRVLGGLRSVGVGVAEAVRADGARWWSYTCADPACCPADGTPYDATSSLVAAEAVVAGLARAPSRDALREQFEPLPLPRASFEKTLIAMFAGMADERPLDEVGLTVALRGAVSSTEPPPMDELVRIVLGVQTVELRDVAWSMMTRANAAEHFAFWAGALRAVPDDMLAPVGSLAGFAAWLTGRGVLASHAAERVLAVEPAYAMADLLLDVCAATLNPDVWSFGEQSAERGPAG